MLKGLLTSKWVLLTIAALIVACVFLYQRNEINKATLETTRIELDQAKRDIETQKATIDLMQRDANVQSDLMRKAQDGIARAREQAIVDAQALTQRDLGKEANTDALALEDALNEQFRRLLGNIQQTSR